MDGDGGGIVGGGLSDLDVSDGGAGMESTDRDLPDSGSAVLQSLGYIDSGGGRDQMDGVSTNSRFSVLKSVILAAMAGLIGLSLLYFLLGELMAVFGV